MMRILKALLFSLAVLPLAASCAARISGVLHADGQAELQVQASLEPRMAALIGGLAAASGTAQPGAPILNGPAISASMASAPGIASVMLENTGPAAIAGPIRIARIGDFLAHGSGRPGFIDFEQGPSGGRFAVNLSLDSGPGILALLSREISDYLGALMAPFATGEQLAKEEYLALVGTVYGRGIADEISHSAIHASIDFPGLVQSAKGGTFSGRRAEFRIPLLDILVLETPLSYEVTWR